MNHFRALLEPAPQSTPRDDQDRASKGLAKAVGESNLRWWKDRDNTPSTGERLLLVVAPYSQYDLFLLDLIDTRLKSAKSPDVQVYVANLLDYASQEQLEADIPGIGRVHQTPVAAFWESGKPMQSAWGKKGRDLAAEVIGLPADELNRQVMADYSARRGFPDPAAGPTEGFNEPVGR